MPWTPVNQAIQHSWHKPYFLIKAADIINYIKESWLVTQRGAITYNTCF
jgi:hypothetical protein